jgi:hypothetical protein
MLLSIKGIKIAYPSNAADIKGLMKAAYFDPNPVVMLEHKGLYWSKVPVQTKQRPLSLQETTFSLLEKATSFLRRMKIRLRMEKHAASSLMGWGYTGQRQLQKI